MTDEGRSGKNSPPARPADPLGYAWDWSSTTHTAPPTPGKRRIVSAGGLAGSDTMTPTGLVDDLLGALGAETVSLGKGLQGWTQSIHAFDAGGYKTGAVYFGGGREDVHVISSSAQAHDARSAVVGVGEAITARVDTCVDTDVPFEDLWSMLSGVAGPRTKVRYIEGWLGNGTPTGRTLYVGAPTSAIQVRLYEKWLESPGMYVEGTNRVEVQLRPPSRGKALVSTWGPAETFCATKLTRRVAEALGTSVAAPGTLQKSKGTPDLERSIAALGDQYGGVFRKWMNHSGGDLGKVLDYLHGESEAPEARGPASDQGEARS